MYRKRRSYLAKKLPAVACSWSTSWLSAVLGWAAHLERHPSEIWSAETLRWRGQDWLRDRRVAFETASAAGRTATRSGRAAVTKRWHDGVSWAASALQLPAWPTKAKGSSWWQQRAGSMEEAAPRLA